MKNKEYKEVVQNICLRQAREEVCKIFDALPGNLKYVASIGLMRSQFEKMERVFYRLAKEKILNP